MNAMPESFHHDRFYLGKRGGEWYVGDREACQGRIAHCTSREKAIRVWRALIAQADAADPVALPTIELESLREAHRDNETCIAELKRGHQEQQEELLRLYVLIDELHSARHNRGFPPKPEPSPPATKKRARKSHACPTRGCSQTDGKPCAYAHCPNREAKA